MTTLLEYYSTIHKLNNLLTVLLRCLNLFSKAFNIFENLFTKCYHTAGIIVPCIMLKIIQAYYLTPSLAPSQNILGLP